jgi:hypothetical protein
MTLPAFSSREREQAKVYLATTVTAMMGRKFEEEDWAKVYAAAKGFRASAWSNFDIDVMQGNLGVEHKMYSQSGASSLLECCGRSFMHPAGTRAIRIPVGISDATEAAQDILRQYGRKIEERTSIIRTLNRYHHDRSTRESAIDALVVAGMSRPKALSLVPEERYPTGSPDDEPDMRFGWLLWRRDLAEFLYFEERMVAPDASAYFGEWHVRQTSGRRLPSRSLWVFRRATNIKEYSIQPMQARRSNLISRCQHRETQTSITSAFRANASSKTWSEFGSAPTRPKRCLQCSAARQPMLSISSFDRGWPMPTTMNNRLVRFSSHPPCRYLSDKMRTARCALTTGVSVTSTHFADCLTGPFESGRWRLNK